MLEYINTVHNTNGLRFELTENALIAMTQSGYGVEYFEWFLSRGYEIVLTKRLIHLLPDDERKRKKILDYINSHNFTIEDDLSYGRAGCPLIN
jgi:hypothetical protein